MESRVIDLFHIIKGKQILDCVLIKVWHPEYGIDFIYKCWEPVEKAL